MDSAGVYLSKALQAKPKCPNENRVCKEKTKEKTVNVN